MRGLNRWWVLCAVAVMLAVPACTENDIDTDDQDVVLEVVSFSAPAVAGELEVGFCNANPTQECLSNDNCADTDFCVLPLFPGECTIIQWSMTLANLPLSEGASESPFNDVILKNLVIDYDWPGALPDFTRSIGLGGVVVPAGGNTTIQFFPITFADIQADDLGVNLNLTIDAVSVAGIDVFMPPAPIQLVIDDCLP